MSFRNRFSATMRSFQISAVAPSTFLNRLAADVRSRTAANGLSTTFVVRRCLQCPAGKSKNAVIRPQSPARISTALGYVSA